jgi:hypothetical protein
MSDTMKQPPMRQVTSFLLKMGGHCLATFSDDEATSNSIIHAWGVRGRVVMIHDYAGDNGCRVYIPADGGADELDATLGALRAYANQDVPHALPPDE